MADKKPITIKKYANRRLYHTGTSTYVTLDDLALMVQQGDDFVVHDAKTGDDITRAVLGQIIFEQENRGQHMLPVAFLRQLIRYYGDSMQALVPSYLETSLSAFARDEEKLRDQMGNALPGKAFEVMEDQTKRNMEMFAEAMRMWTPFANQSEKESADAAKDPESRETDIEALRNQLKAMQETINTLADKDK